MTRPPVHSTPPTNTPTFHLTPVCPNNDPRSSVGTSCTRTLSQRTEVVRTENPDLLRNNTPDGNVTFYKYHRDRRCEIYGYHKGVHTVVLTEVCSRS